MDYYRATTDGPPEYLRSETAQDEPGRAIGRCPDCGEAVEVETRMHQPARVLPHGCPARVCEYPYCRIIALPEGMAQFEDGPWYCPSHALLLVAKTLVLLYRVEGDADWSSICELIAETLPDVIRRSKNRRVILGGSARRRANPVGRVGRSVPRGLTAA